MNRGEIGKAGKKHREAKGVSKYSVAKQTGLSFGQVTDIEQGRKNYTIDSLNLYLGCIGLQIDITEIKPE